MSDAGRPVPAPDLAFLARRPSATFLWGESRSVITRVVYALARANDPRFYWLDIRQRGTDSDGPGPVELGWVPAEHVFLTEEPVEAAPQHAVGNLALWSVVRSDEPEKVVAGLSDFLRLPPIAQEILSRFGIGEGPHVVVVANSDRVRGYYSQAPRDVRHVLEPFLAGEVSPFFSALAPPGEGRWSFDHVFEVKATDLARWAEGTLKCEQAPEGSPFHVGESLPLASIPELARALRGEEQPRGPGH